MASYRSDPIFSATGNRKRGQLDGFILFLILSPDRREQRATPDASFTVGWRGTLTDGRRRPDPALASGKGKATLGQNPPQEIPLQFASQSVCLSRRRAVQKRLSRSKSHLGRSLLDTHAWNIVLHYVRVCTPTAKGRLFNTAFAKLLWPLVCSLWV